MSEELDAFQKARMERIKANPNFKEGLNAYRAIKADPEKRKALSMATGMPEKYLFPDPDPWDAE